jgi:hypothetical protein
MKRIYLLFLSALLMVAGCKESFLDTENLTQKSSSNYPGTPAEADQAVTGAYSVLPGMGAMSNIVLLSELMSDDRFGGGGMNDRDPQAISYFRVVNMNETATTWSKYYQGIFRCNSLLGSLKLVSKWDSNAQRQQVFGETSFLRGYFYLDLARLYGQVPLVTDPLPANNPKASADALFGQIALDLKNAIDSLPATTLTPAWKANNLGRASKWAAEGLMARAFLFYTGYYQKTEIALPGGGKITKQQVVDWVDDCVAHSGASLVPDFRNIWPYSIKEATNYGYAKTNNLNWVGDGSSESIFDVVYTTLKTDNWGQNNFYNNTMCLFFGQRNPTAQLPFGHGWGFGPVNPNFYTKWDVNDIRRQGSVWKVDDATEGTDTYVWGSDMQWNETGLYGKKYIPVNINYNGSVVNYSVKLYSALNDIQLDNSQNLIILRLADVMLMGAELGSSKAQSYMDAIRTRAKLPSVPVTLANIQDERHHELAFEGIRYFDLLRWYGKGAGAVIKAAKTGAVIYNMSVKTTIDADRGGAYFNIDKRVTDTGGFLMIPDDQIQLSKGILIQNAGWTSSADMMF